jgi:peptidoglycan/LPS O-acetylase OafA/YrhL
LLGAIATLRWKLGSAVVAAGMVLAMVIAWSGRGDLAGTTLEPVTLARLAPYFALGSLAWCLRSWTPHSWALPVAACALAVAALHTSAFVPAFALALAVGVVWLAHIPLGPLARWGRFGDFSYGLYIFAYPVQQALVATFPEWGQVQHGIAAYSITLACAIGSWKLVEAPALRLKRYLPSTRSTSVKMENG